MSVFPSNKRHSGRKQCSFCGVTMTPHRGLANQSKKSLSASESQSIYDAKTWDHLIPRSVGGKLTVPCCQWCNLKKGDSSLSDFLASEALNLRRKLVLQREPDAEPMSESILRALKNEDLASVRRAFEYHAK